MNHYNELLTVLLCRKQQADNELLNILGKEQYTYRERQQLLQESKLKS